MLTQIIWAVGVFLQFLLLLRGVQAKWQRRFPLFYSYNLFVFLEDVSLFALYQWFPRRYAPAYWICEFVAVVLGSLVLFEVYRVALRPYPGTARMARNLLGFVFALTSAKALVNHSYGAVWWPARDAAELERNLRTVQAFAVLALVIVILVYAIPRGRHLKGILAGYGLLVANSVVQLSLLSHLGSSFQSVLVYIQPFTYDIVLCIWTAALWSAEAERSDLPDDSREASGDHAMLVLRAKQALQSVRHGLPGTDRRLRLLAATEILVLLANRPAPLGSLSNYHAAMIGTFSFSERRSSLNVTGISFKKNHPVPSTNCFFKSAGR
jgi:hypothetical protein